MEDQIQSPILITGCARSGSSMIAGVIRICGAFAGLTSGATRSRGVNENDKIHDDLIVPYLESIGADPAGQYPVPKIMDLTIPADWRRKVTQSIISDGYKKGPWMYKGSKMCLIWPIWHYAFPNAKWVIVRRRTGDIVRSCLNTTFMNAFTNEENQISIGAQGNEYESWVRWVHLHEQRFIEMLQEGLNCKIIWPERMVRGDYEQIFETIEWLGLKWKSEVLSFIDPKLWKARCSTNLERVI